MRLYILDPTRIVYEGNVREAVLPGEDGELSILDFHQPFLYRLRSGYIKISQLFQQQKKEDFSTSAQTNIMIKNGIAWMKGNELRVLVQLGTVKKELI
jgi:F0F1-type ATP synthase epsilon subunit